MSRIGKKPIQIPSGVKVSLADGVLKVEGPKGKLERDLNERVEVKVDADQITVAPGEGETNTALQGLPRSRLRGARARPRASRRSWFAARTKRSRCGLACCYARRMSAGEFEDEKTPTFWINGTAPADQGRPPAPNEVDRSPYPKLFLIWEESYLVLPATVGVWFLGGPEADGVARSREAAVAPSSWARPTATMGRRPTVARNSRSVTRASTESRMTESAMPMTANAIRLAPRSESTASLANTAIQAHMA